MQVTSEATSATGTQMFTEHQSQNLECQTVCPGYGVVHACVLSRLSCVRLWETLWTAAHQAPLFMGFSKEYIGVARIHVLLQRIFPTQGSNLHLVSPALAGGFFTTSATWEAQETQGIC